MEDIGTSGIGLSGQAVGSIQHEEATLFAHAEINEGKEKQSSYLHD